MRPIDAGAQHEQHQPDQESVEHILSEVGSLVHALADGGPVKAGEEVKSSWLAPAAQLKVIVTDKGS